MKHMTLLVLIQLIIGGAFCQNKLDNKAIEAKINEQVWKPFMQAFKNRNAEKFNSLHTDDVLRISSRGIRSGPEYKQSVVKSYARPNAPKTTIEFSFEHRIYAEKTGYEVGYYHITYTRVKDGVESEESHYAQFHVRLRKEDGVWRIAQDWDTNNISGRPITAEDFAKGRPME